MPNTEIFVAQVMHFFKLGYNLSPRIALEILRSYRLERFI